jgi:hypothetical protein
MSRKVYFQPIIIVEIRDVRVCKYLMKRIGQRSQRNRISDSLDKILMGPNNINK